MSDPDSDGVVRPAAPVAADETASAVAVSSSEYGALSAGGMLLLLSCIAIWGVNAVAFKVATKPPYGFDPIFMHGLRFLVVAPCFVALVAVRSPGDLRLTPREMGRYAVFGFFAIAFSETLQTTALRFTSVANLALLSHGTISMFTAMWALILFRQRISRTGWIGAVIALSGVAIVAVNSAGGLRFGGEAWKGDALAVGRSVVHSCYLLILAGWLRQRSVLQVTVYNCVFGALWLLPYVVWKAPTFDWGRVPAEAWWSLAWTIAPATLYAFLAWNWSMRHVGAVVATNLFYLMPLSAAVAARLLLGEPITTGQILGGLIIVVGIVLLRWDALLTAGLRVPSLSALWIPWGRR